MGAVTMRLGGGARRDGFEILRNIVARYRAQWADRTKPPALKQFVKMATPACANSSSTSAGMPSSTNGSR